MIFWTFIIYLGLSLFSSAAASAPADEMILKCSYDKISKENREKIGDGARFFRLVENEGSNNFRLFMYFDTKGRWGELRQTDGLYYAAVKVSEEEIRYDYTSDSGASDHSYVINRVTASFYANEGKYYDYYLQGSCSRVESGPKDKVSKF